MRKITRLIVVCLLICCLTSAVLAAEETVKIGALAPLTGPSALLGTRLMMGFEVAVDIINDRGGVWNGRKLELVKGDASSVETSMSEAERLITTKNVRVILDGHTSSNSMVVSKVCEQHGCIYVATVGIDDEITNRGYDKLFRITVKSSTFAEGCAKFVREVVAEKIGKAPDDIKVAVIHEDSSYGTSVGTFAKNAVEDYGMNLVHYEGYSSKVNDLTSLIMRLKMKKPDVIIATQYAHDGILFWQQAEKLGFNVKAYVGTGAIHSMPDWISNCGDKGNYVFSYELGNINPKNLSPKGQALALEFRKRYEKKFNEPLTSMSVIGFQGAMLFFEQMLDPAGSLEAEALKAAALKADVPDGDTIYGFGLKFDPKTHQNIRAKGCIYQWLDGEFTIVWPNDWADATPVLPMPTWNER